MERFLIITNTTKDPGNHFSEELKNAGRLEEFISVPEGQHGPVTFNENTFKKMTDFFLKEAK